jgi:hypothetical protein
MVCPAPPLMVVVVVVCLVGCARPASACDAGVFFGQNCTQALAEAHSPECTAWPQGGNATSAYSVLTWLKGGAGYGGMNDLGGDVFLSTMLNMGCGGGYFGSQMHYNTSSMNLDWAVWDIGLPGGKTSTMNTIPITAVNKDGKPVDRRGNLCSTVEPTPAGFTACPCTRYGGEGFGTHCGIGKADGFLWEIGTPYLLNVSMDPTVPNNESAATFSFTVENTKSKQIIEIGKILTTNPSGTLGIPAGKYRCDQMPVGGGSFQEYYVSVGHPLVTACFSSRISHFAGWWKFHKLGGNCRFVTAVSCLVSRVSCLALHAADTVCRANLQGCGGPYWRRPADSNDGLHILRELFARRVSTAD